jgi:hypothetical protein
MSEEPRTYSILLHVRRIVHEDAYIAVPVTDAIMMTKEDGTAAIDPEAFIAEAIRISADPRVEWRQESSTTEPHPTQQPLPEDRTSFDAFYADSNPPE